MADSKPFYESKTLWFNVVAAVASYLGTLPQTNMVLYAVLGANILLRLITKGPLTIARDAATEDDGSFPPTPPPTIIP